MPKESDASKQVRLSFQTESNVVKLKQRPEPPKGATPELAAEWRKITAGLPITWFGPETLALLESYCGHILSSHRIAGLIRIAEARVPLSIPELDRLYGMMARESNRLAQLATKMRLTQSTNYLAKKSRVKDEEKPKPWE